MEKDTHILKRLAEAHDELHSALASLRAKASAYYDASEDLAMAKRVLDEDLREYEMIKAEFEQENPPDMVVAMSHDLSAILGERAA
jgi:hypothetical protein